MSKTSWSRPHDMRASASSAGGCRAARRGFEGRARSRRAAVRRAPRRAPRPRANAGTPDALDGARLVVGASDDAAPVRLVEMFSGSGMTRVALERVLGASRVLGVAAIDNSDVANAVYAANFPDDPRGPLRENIEHLTAARLDHPDLAADAWTLSPPCQPYTRRGKRLGPDDPRAAAFAHLLRLLPTLKNPPDRVFVENVVGFERSATRDALVDALERAGYEWRERRRASPSDAGVPYVRDRYYLLAKKRGLGFRDSGGPEADSDPVGGGARALAAADADAFAFSRIPNNQKRGSTVGAYLDPASASDASLAVRGATVLKYREWLDVVAPSSATCQCFTSGYGRTVFGGSVLASEAFARRYCVPAAVEKDGGPTKFEGRFRVRSDFAAEAAAAAERGGEGARGSGCSSHEEDEDEDVWLRYFSPREIANLHGLDERFALPEALTRRQLYRVLGNSVSVDVVAELLGHLFDDAFDERRK